MEGRRVDEERQPMTRDPVPAAQAGQSDLHQQERHMPDTRYPRSVEGVIRIIAVVSIALNLRKIIYTFVFFLSQ